MPDYGEILAFLAANPPQLSAERELHASLVKRRRVVIERVTPPAPPARSIVARIGTR